MNKAGTYTYYNYDAQDRLVVEEQYALEVTHLGSKSYYYAGSLLQSVTDAMGYVTEYLYDRARRTATSKLSQTISGYKDNSPLLPESYVACRA